MKEVILSADGDQILYSVPDAVAARLDKYCLEFRYRLQNTRLGEKYLNEDGVYCYTEADFIDYLNQFLFPRETSKPVKNLGLAFWEEPPEEYRSLPRYNF